MKTENSRVLYENMGSFTSAGAFSAEFYRRMLGTGKILVKTLFLLKNTIVTGSELMIGSGLKKNHANRGKIGLMGRFLSEGAKTC